MVAGYCVCWCDYTLCDRERQQRSIGDACKRKTVQRGTQLGASKEQEVVQVESKTQCKRSKAENCECRLKYRIPSKEYYKDLKNAEKRPSGAKLTNRVKLPSQAKLSGRERLSSREKMDKGVVQRIKITMESKNDKRIEGA